MKGKKYSGEDKIRILRQADGGAMTPEVRHFITGSLCLSHTPKPERSVRARWLVSLAG